MLKLILVVWLFWEIIVFFKKGNKGGPFIDVVNVLLFVHSGLIWVIAAVLPLGDTGF